MNNNKTLSTNKLVFFIVFVCTAIMASLFVYRMNHSQQNTHDDNLLLFPAGRDIKSFNLVSANGKPFKTENLLNHWTLMFFGFTHCSKVCPTTLAMLSQAHQNLHQRYPNLQIVLVSLDPKRDDVKTLAQYTKKFNPAFIGVSGKVNELRKLQSQLGIYSERQSDLSNSNYQLQHSSSILLINPKGKWVGMFKYGMNAKQFTMAYNRSMQQLS